MKTKHKSIRDLTGQTFGRLTALAPLPKRRHSNVVWACKCACGKECEATSGSLLGGYKKSCGCLARKPLQVQPDLNEIKSIMITKPIIVKRVLELAAQSGTKPNVWVSECLEDWLLKHRSGRFTGDASRHDAREHDPTANYFH